ncbi:MAG: putative inorganic carbon transporter subunit DabA [Nannocystaceae bacterium]
MKRVAGAPTDTSRSRTRSATSHLPAAGPHRAVHPCNTLHAFETLPFHDGVAAAQRVLGGKGYLAEAQYREAYARGRIDDRDLELAIDYRGVFAEAQGDGTDALAERRAILRAAMLHDLDPEPAALVHWQLVEELAFTEPGDAERWPACVAAVRRIGGEARADAIALGRELIASLGQRSHRDLVLALVGVDVCDRVDRWIIRVCAAQLDEGLAAQTHAPRRFGLYEGWRRFQRPGHGVLAGLPSNAVLPEQPLDAVAMALAALGVPPERVEAYVTRVLQHLPGWGGMIHWRETHPEYRPELPPVAVVDYLALRLLGEWSELATIVRRQWRCEVGGMIELLRERPGEVGLRAALWSGLLDDGAARAARRLLRPQLRTDEAACRSLLERSVSTGDGATQVRAWQLHRLCRALRIHADELHSTPTPRLARLLTILDEYGPTVRLPIWQEAYEIHYRDQVLEALHETRSHRQPLTGRRVFAIVTCIDDREEGFRRHLEEIEPRAETFGSGGFFGIPISFRGRNEDEFSALCPLGVVPMHRVLEVPCDDARLRARRFDRGRAAARRWRGHWRGILGHGGASLLGAYAVGFFAWLWLLGQLVFPRQFERVRKAVRRALMPEHPTVFITDEDCSEPAHAIAGFSLREQVERINGTLNNIGMTSNFSRIVAIVGHGSASTNNPHLSAYDCGACGGRHGGPNSRLFCLMANSPAVRAGLRGMGIDIPDDTWFVGGEHNTAADEVSWSDLDRLPDGHREDFRHLAEVIEEALVRSAHERSRKFEHAPPDGSPQAMRKHVQTRTLDPSQARPELNHATNAVAVFGRRGLTRGSFFDRRMFLVSYDPAIDPEGRILERLLMALGPVGAGINLEYYFSRCDPQIYGAGTKLPHNVVGLIGVMDGGSSDLRTGLPTQMTEVHEPVRLLLVLENTPEIVAAIAGRQPVIRTLVENAWVLVSTVDPEDGRTHVYVPGRGFVPWHPRGQIMPVVHNSAAWYHGHADFLPPARIAPPRRIASGT